MKHASRLIIAISIVAVSPQWVSADSVDELITVIKSIGPKGEGSLEATAAMRQLVRQDESALPQILSGFEGANELAENYLRGAFESIADEAVQAEGTLPTKELEAFLADRSNPPRARRLAFEWLVQVDETARERLVPGFLDDPSPELRREAVSELIAEAAAREKNDEKSTAISVYQKALSGAVDEDQVKEIVKPLEKFGVEVNLPKHFGLLTSWQIIGPFDNREKVGFDAVYPPETEINLSATYDGQLGPVKWTSIATDDEFGILDIGKQVENYKGSVMYLTTEFVSAGEQAVEFRLGTANAWKLWVNGELIFGREEYHRGMQFDQYKVAAKLKPGRNVVLLKILQNEQTDDWAQRYQFQMRVVDASGRAVPSQRD